MGTFLGPTDLENFATIPEGKAEDMIEDAEAMAVLVAPCITAEGFSYTAAVKAILRGAILRWNDGGSGALTQQGAGPFSQSFDTRQERKAMFWPSEIKQLQNLCAGLGGGVYTTSLAGPPVAASDTVMNDLEGWGQRWGWPY